MLSWCRPKYYKADGLDDPSNFICNVGRRNHEAARQWLTKQNERGATHTAHPKPELGGACRGALCVRVGAMQKGSEKNLIIRLENTRRLESGASL